MLKRLLVTAALVVAAGSMVGVSTVNAEKDQPAGNEDNITICHRDNAANKPYVSITVDKNALNGGGKDDHTSHTGPVASSFAVATALKKDHIKWGDIIPPFDSYPGYNWTAEGQAVYESDCKFPTSEEQALVDYSLVCDVNNHQAVITFTNTGNKDGSATVNGTPVNVPLAGAVVNVPTAVTGTQITIVIDDVTVYDQLVTCEPGKGAGGETPATPATPVAATPAASLPFTGDNTQVIALVASAIAAITAVVSVIVKTALVKQL